MANEIVGKIKSKLGDKIKQIDEKSNVRVYIDLDPKDIPEAASYLYSDIECRFATASGVDTRAGIEILYHFSYDKTGCIFTLRTLVEGGREKPEIESIALKVPAAEWIEREIWELLGVSFRNHPNLKRLLLAEDFPEGKCPLRRDYKE